jgi:hypothetical protein
MQWLTVSGYVSAGDSFVETFDGNGPYESPLGIRKGLDNPKWNFGGSGELRDGGYAFALAPNQDLSIVEQVLRDLSDDCSLVDRIEIRDAYQGPIPEFHFPRTTSWFMLSHRLSTFFPEGNRMSVLVLNQANPPCAITAEVV